MIAYDCGPGKVICLSFSPDGTLLASCSGVKNRKVHLWEGSDAKWVNSGLGSAYLTFHPNGLELTYGQGVDGGSFNLRDRRRTAQLPEHGSQIIGLGYSENGRRILLACRNSKGSPPFGIAVWPVSNQESKGLNVYEYGPVSAFDALPDCSRFAWLTTNLKIKIASAVGAVIAEIPLVDPGNFIALSNRGLIAVANTLDIHVYSTESRTRISKLQGHTKPITGIAFNSAGNSLISGSYDETVRLWNAESGVETSCFSWRTGPISCVAVAPDGLRYACGSVHGAIAVWDADS